MANKPKRRLGNIYHPEHNPVGISELVEKELVIKDLVLSESPIRDLNKLNPLQLKIIKILGNNGPMARTQMVKTLGRPRTTIYDSLVVLIKHEMIRKFSRQINSRGRPMIFFKLKEE